MERASKLMKLATVLCMVVLCKAIESPQYEVVHEESDFEVRLYSEAKWISGIVREELSYARATIVGFNRLFLYIQGGNLNHSRIALTTPVLTSLVPGAGPLHSPAFAVSLYLPAKFQSDPPTPLPELHLKPWEWGSHYVAVRKFSGFPVDEIIVKEAEKLAFSLSRSPWVNSTSSDSGYAYSVAQYSSPLQLIGRVNEIWVDIDVFEINSCNQSAVASH